MSILQPQLAYIQTDKLNNMPAPFVDIWVVFLQSNGQSCQGPMGRHQKQVASQEFSAGDEQWLLRQAQYSEACHLHCLPNTAWIGISECKKAVGLMITSLPSLASINCFLQGQSTFRPMLTPGLGTPSGKWPPIAGLRALLQMLQAPQKVCTPYQAGTEKCHSPYETRNLAGT